MKITFPHMGNLYIAAKGLFEDFKHEVILPNYNNDKTKEIGMKYAPEFICLPFKLNLGNFIEAIKKGADTVVILGGCGPCRFGYYGALEKELLKKLKYNVEFIILEPPIYGINNLIKEFKKLFNFKDSIYFYKFYKNLILTDDIEKKIQFLRPREKVKGSVEKIYSYFKNEIFNSFGSEQISKLINDVLKQLNNIQYIEYNVPKIGIIGEIYTIIDDYSNMYIQKILGDMGFEVDRNLYLSSWINEHILKGVIGLNNKEIIENSRNIIERMIGGHARETLAFIKIYQSKNYDGLIHVFPLTCMPEIIAKAIITNIKDSLSIPIINITIDEHSSETGLKTRIEAFADLIKVRSGNENYEKILSWD